MKAGDAIHVETQCIDKNVYTYYNAVIQISDDGSGSGITPADQPSKISTGLWAIFQLIHPQKILLSFDNSMRGYFNEARSCLIAGHLLVILSPDKNSKIL